MLTSLSCKYLLHSNFSLTSLWKHQLNCSVHQIKKDLKRTHSNVKVKTTATTTLSITFILIPPRRFLSTRGTGKANKCMPFFFNFHFHSFVLVKMNIPNKKESSLAKNLIHRISLVASHLVFLPTRQFHENQSLRAQENTYVFESKLVFALGNTTMAKLSK